MNLRNALFPIYSVRGVIVSFKLNTTEFKPSIFIAVLLLIQILTSSFLFCPLSSAQLPLEPEIEFSSSLNPVGSGARALGMGGAFIAFADDATAASWNPAGLKHLLRPEVSVVANYDNRGERFSFTRSQDASNEYKISNEDLNYLSMAYPFMWLDRNIIISLNYQNLYSLDRRMQFQWKFDSSDDPNFPSNLSYVSNVNYRQEGDLRALSPAMAVFLTPSLFFGMTLNFWSDKFSDNGWIEEHRELGQWILSDGNDIHLGDTYVERIDHYSFSGFNMNFGLLWDINQYITFGAVLKTPFTARLKHKGRSLKHQIRYIDPDENIIQNSQTEDLKLRMPFAYGIGLAIKPTDRLIFDLDIYRMEWDDYVIIDPSGNKMDPITGLPKGESSIKPTHHIRLGGEYVFILKKMTLSFRSGMFYDPEPASGNPDDFYGLGLGVGITLGSFAIDWAYQYRIGENVEGDSIKGEKSSADVKQHLFYNSIIYYF